MATGTIDDIYERHIRPLSAQQRLRLLALIAEDLAEEAGMPTSEKLHDVMEFHGVGRGSWDGSDAQEFVNELRAEWDEREAALWGQGAQHEFAHEKATDSE